MEILNQINRSLDSISEEYKLKTLAWNGIIFNAILYWANRGFENPIDVFAAQLTELTQALYDSASRRRSIRVRSRMPDALIVLRSASYSTALMILNRAGILSTVLDKSGIRRIHRHPSVFKHESRDSHITDCFQPVKDRVRIPQSHECAHVSDVLTDIDVFELGIASLYLLMNIIAIRACWHSVDFDHGLHLLFLFSVYHNPPYLGKTESMSTATARAE